MLVITRDLGVRADVGDDYVVDYIARDRDLKDKVIDSVLGGGAEAVAGTTLSGSPYAEVVRFFDEQARSFAAFNDPRGVYAYALVDVD
ncbi:MAG: hypothetical protein IAG13_00365 [Deltaproteobacteria bacterium]|nr:hypothetical protein [Nannocystaceae bacterium]